MGANTKIKWDNELKRKILENALVETSLDKLAKSVGMSYTTLRLYLKKDPTYAKRVKNTLSYAAKEIIKAGLFSRALGSEEVTITKEFNDVEILEDGSERLIRTKVSTRKIPPDVSALKLLANKYAEGDYSENSKVDVNVQITARNTALTFDERLKLLQDDAEDKPLEADYTLLN